MISLTNQAEKLDQDKRRIMNHSFGYHYAPNSVPIAKLAFKYPFGGATEREGQRGISHLMEHLMCKTFDDLRPKMTKLGIDHNAYTNNLSTVFYFAGLTRFINEMTPLLVKRLIEHPQLWSRVDFENEKKTVIQEYKDVFNDQLYGTYHNVMRKEYGYFSAIGCLHDIENFSYDDSLRLSSLYERPSLIVEVGNQSSLVDFKAIHYDYNYDIVKNRVNSDLLENVPKQGKTIAGVVGQPTDKLQMLAFLSICLTGSLEAPLYQEIREKRGLSYYSLGWCLQIGETSVPLFAASTSIEKENELKEVYTEFFNKKLSDVISEERFNDCYDQLKIDEEKSNILYHKGVNDFLLSDFNPFDLKCTYSELIDFGTEQLKILKPFSY